MLTKILGSIFLGIIEGITEWLPISSTGHMILINELMQIKETDFFNSQIFLYVIQLGAILAIVTLYFNKLNPFSPSKTHKEKAQTWKIWYMVIISCIPAGFFGLLLNDLMDSISNWIVVSATLVLYGIAFLFIERKEKAVKINELSILTYKTAFFIGLFQVLSIIPGTSRSGATILGAMLLGCSRSVAAEFSFYLAIPIMFGVSFLKIITNDFPMTLSHWCMLALSMSVAYIVSLLSVNFLVNYVKEHDFKLFGWYRIALGILVVLFFMFLI